MNPIPIAVRAVRRLHKRERERAARQGEITICAICIEHFGIGYPLHGGYLAALTRYHRRHVQEVDVQG
jgi:hypothetical protein